MLPRMGAHGTLRQRGGGAKRTAAVEDGVTGPHGTAQFPSKSTHPGRVPQVLGVYPKMKTPVQRSFPGRFATAKRWNQPRAQPQVSGNQIHSARWG